MGAVAKRREWSLKDGQCVTRSGVKKSPPLSCAEYVRNVLDTNVLQGAGTQFIGEDSACSSDLVKNQAEMAEVDTPSYTLRIDTAAA